MRDSCIASDWMQLAVSGRKLWQGRSRDEKETQLRKANGLRGKDNGYVPSENSPTLRCFAPARTAKDGSFRTGGNPEERNYFGNSTESMTWITPFEHTMSAFTTLALSTITAPPFTLIVSDSPLTVFAEFISVT